MLNFDDEDVPIITTHHNPSTLAATNPFTGTLKENTWRHHAPPTEEWKMSPTRGTLAEQILKTIKESNQFCFRLLITKISSVFTKVSLFFVIV